MKSKYLSIRVSDEMKSELQKEADAAERTLSWWIERILRDYLAARK